MLFVLFCNISKCLTDNGGNERFGASNAPLRGNKGFLFEGGIKSVSFVNGGFLENNAKQMSVVRKDLFHISDWAPTILGLAGVSLEGLQMDGLDIWKSLR